jgi:protein involved in ribonucleotide reduction
MAQLTSSMAQILQGVNLNGNNNHHNNKNQANDILDQRCNLQMLAVQEVLQGNPPDEVKVKYGFTNSL